jgi:uncharacterized protein YqjF (DUF2071 family)
VNPGEAARRRLEAGRFEPLLRAEWNDVAFLHFEVAPRRLQNLVAYPLDLRDGRAFVSLVAFTMARLRLSAGGGMGEWLLRPIGTHPFLNVRTYVKHCGEPGIQFLAEWMTNPISVHLGRPLFGLPYRRGTANLHNDPSAGSPAWGEIVDPHGARLRYEITPSDGSVEPGSCGPGTLDEFLLERYTCFTMWRRMARLFRVWHAPWKFVPCEAHVSNRGLLELTGGWFRGARLLGAHRPSLARRAVCVDGTAALHPPRHRQPHCGGSERCVREPLHPIPTPLR